jgi:hypothetical protein
MQYPLWTLFECRPNKWNQAAVYRNRWVTEMNANNMEQHRESGKNAHSRLSESDMSSIVEAGGGRYVGVIDEIPGKMEQVVLFTSPQTRSTLGLPSSRLTVAAVREQLAESDAAFTQAGSK